MTQEEKELLFKDLCGRLPYEPYLEWEDGKVIRLNPISYEMIAKIYFQSGENIIRPYLRPMSSITEEEKKEYYGLLSKYDVSCFISRIGAEVFDWLNVHHFDYRGLIEKGLALEAPEGMYD